MSLNGNCNQFRNNYQNNNYCFQQEENDDETNRFNASIDENLQTKTDDNYDENGDVIERDRIIKLLVDSNKTDAVSNYFSSSSSYRIRKVPAQFLKENLTRIKIKNNKMNGFPMKKILKLILNYFLLFVFILMIYLVFIQAYILFQNTVRHSSITSLYRNPKFSNDLSSNQNIQESISVKEKLSNDEFSSQMSQIKTAINKLYSSIDNPLEYCPIEPVKLEGQLNVLKILDTFNLTNLVEFHDNTTYNTTSNQYIKNELYYVNGFNSSDKNVSLKDMEFYNLWHSNDMRMLNISSILLGEDGSRVELGK
jgi:hypothetical protein